MYWSRPVWAGADPVISGRVTLETPAGNLPPQSTDVLYSMGLRGNGCTGNPQLCPAYLKAANDRVGWIILIAALAGEEVEVTGDIVGDMGGTPLWSVQSIRLPRMIRLAQEQGLTAAEMASSLREAGYAEGEIDAWLMAEGLA